MKKEKEKEEERKKNSSTLPQYPNQSNQFRSE